MRRSCLAISVAVSRAITGRPRLRRCVATRTAVTAREGAENDGNDHDLDRSATSISRPPEIQRKKRGRPRRSLATDDDLDPILAPKVSHDTLASFLTHASTTNLDRTSTVYVGTLYEYICALTLSKLGFSLRRTGRANDLGIDLLGKWTIPPAHTHSPTITRVLIQCKAEQPQPRHVRELEGAIYGAPARWRGEGAMALLVARGAATKGVREAVRRSGGAVGFVFIDVEENVEVRSASVSGSDVEDWGRGQGRIRQVLWNAVAAEKGLEGVGVAVKYDGAGGEEVVLTRDGKPVVFDATKKGS